MFPSQMLCKHRVFFSKMQTFSFPLKFLHIKVALKTERVLIFNVVSRGFVFKQETGDAF